MELSHLVQPGHVMWRRLLVMAALGALLLGAKTGLRHLLPHRSAVLPPGVDAEEAILVDQGLRAGWVRTDPVVRRRLADNLRFAGQSGDESALVERAITLGMHRTDPVVRRRLAGRARSLLEVVPEPSPADLEAFVAARPEDFRRPAVLRLEQVFLGADGRSPRALAGVGPTLSGTPEQLAGRLGVDFAEAAAALAVGEEAEIASVFGVHRVRVRAIVPGKVPPLALIHAEAVQVWRDERRPEVYAGRLAALRRTYGASR